MRLDVWDFNPEESVNEKLNKFNQVKDGRGLRKFIKETLHATAGKISHELLGSVEIPIKNLPASGVSGWWNLEKPDTRKQKDRGEIHLSLTLSSDKDQHLTSQEHRHLLKILFAHELQRSNVSYQIRVYLNPQTDFTSIFTLLHCIHFLFSPRLFQLSIDKYNS